MLGLINIFYVYIEYLISGDVISVISNRVS